MFLLLSISAILSSKTINILRYSILLEYSTKASKSLKCFVVSSSRLLIKNWPGASNGSFAFKKNYQYLVRDPEPPTVNNLYGCSEICGKFGF